MHLLNNFIKQNILLVHCLYLTHSSATCNSGKCNMCVAHIPYGCGMYSG